MDEIKQAITILNQGGIVIYPTDTAFGIGCRIDKKDSILRLFKLRRRPKSQATPVLVDSISMAEKYYRSPLAFNVRRLMRSHWPGALTIIYYCMKNLIPFPVRGDGQTLGIRMPDHQVALKLIKGTGVPLLGPSANFHNHKTPYSFKDLDKELIRNVDYVLKGKCKHRKTSTVIDCSKDEWQIVRQGAVKVNIQSTILYIDTSQRDKTIVALVVDGRTHKLVDRSDFASSQTLLPLIAKILGQKKIKLTEIDEIKVNTGPGSFTGLRVGISVANTLGWILNIPVNGKKLTPAEPVYTKSKIDSLNNR